MTTMTEQKIFHLYRFCFRAPETKNEEHIYYSEVKYKMDAFLIMRRQWEAIPSVWYDMDFVVEFQQFSHSHDK